MQKYIFTQSDNPVFSPCRYKITDTAFIINNLLSLKVIIRTDHCICIHLHRGGVFSDRRNTPFLGILSLQDFIIYPVGYLQVNGFTFFKFHSKRNLGLTTCERVKSW